MPRRPTQRRHKVATYGGKPILYADAAPLRTTECLVWEISYPFKRTRHLMITAPSLTVEEVCQMISLTARRFTVRNVTVGLFAMYEIGHEAYYNDARGVNEKGEVVL